MLKKKKKKKTLKKSYEFGSKSKNTKFGVFTSNY